MWWDVWKTVVKCVEDCGGVCGRLCGGVCGSRRLCGGVCGRLCGGVCGRLWWSVWKQKTVVECVEAEDCGGVCGRLCGGVCGSRRLWWSVLDHGMAGSARCVAEDSMMQPSLELVPGVPVDFGCHG